MVVELELSTIRAVMDRRLELERVMGAAHTLAALGCTLLGNSHGVT
jgi:hypothetical protein